MSGIHRRESLNANLSPSSSVVTSRNKLGLQCASVGTDRFVTGGVWTEHDTQSMPEALPWQVGDTIRERYQIEAVLGSGGMGVVYRVYDQIRRRSMALKVLHESERDSLVEEVRREAALLAEVQIQESLQHEGIVRTFEVDRDPKTQRLFFTMEYVEAPSLATLLQKAREEQECPPFTGQQVFAFARQLTTALDHAHRRGVVHLDLKPANILAPANGHIRLLDFGIATHRERHPQAAHTGSAVYIAPEALTAQGDLGPTADIYAVGVLLYQMLTGELFYGHGLGPAAWLKDAGLIPSFPDAWDEIILKALAREPQRRHLSIRLLFQELSDALEGTDWAPYLEQEVFLRHRLSPDSLLATLQPYEYPEPAEEEVGLVETESEPEVLPTHVDFSGNRYTDADVAALAGRTVHSLKLCGSQISDKSLRAIGCVFGLESLNLWETRVTDRGLLSLRKQRQLEELYLSFTEISDQGLAHLKHVNRLQKLYLWRTHIRDRGLKHLLALPGLTLLHLRDTQVTDRGVKLLRKLKHLARLSLAGTKVTNHCIPVLRRFPSLARLDLSDTSIDDRKLKLFARFPTLTYLDLRGTEVTVAGVEKLRLLIPHCEILF